MTVILSAKFCSLGASMHGRQMSGRLRSPIVSPSSLSCPSPLPGRLWRSRTAHWTIARGLHSTAKVTSEWSRPLVAYHSNHIPIGRDSSSDALVRSHAARRLRERGRRVSAVGWSTLRPIDHTPSSGPAVSSMAPAILRRAGVSTGLHGLRRLNHKLPRYRMVDVSTGRTI